MINKEIGANRAQIDQGNKEKVEFSPLKKILGNIRIDRSENQYEMATKLGMSKSYLSSIERGKRDIPRDFTANLEAAYELDDKDKKTLQTICSRSKNFTKIDLRELSEDKKELIYGLYIGEFDEETMALLRDIIINGNKRMK